MYAAIRMSTTLASCVKVNRPMPALSFRYTCQESGLSRNGSSMTLRSTEYHSTNVQNACPEGRERFKDHSTMPRRITPTSTP